MKVLFAIVRVMKIKLKRTCKLHIAPIEASISFAVFIKAITTRITLRKQFMLIKKICCFVNLRGKLFIKYPVYPMIEKRNKLNCALAKYYNTTTEKQAVTR